MTIQPHKADRTRIWTRSHTPGLPSFNQWWHNEDNMKIRGRETHDEFGKNLKEIRLQTTNNGLRHCYIFIRNKTNEEHKTFSNVQCYSGGQKFTSPYVSGVRRTNWEANVEVYVLTRNQSGKADGRQRMHRLAEKNKVKFTATVRLLRGWRNEKYWPNNDRTIDICDMFSMGWHDIIHIYTKALRCLRD